MGSRHVVCEENETLASFIHEKYEAFLLKQPYSENLDATLSKAYKNVCEWKDPIRSLQDASKIRGIGNWMLKLLKDFFVDNGNLSQPSPLEQSPQGWLHVYTTKRRKAAKRYLPQKNSAAYAILITLYKAIMGGKEFMLKQELIDATEASGLSKTSIQPTKASSGTGRFGDSMKDWYSGWSSMKTLVSRGLVVRSSCPAKYMLTEEGKQAAHECITRAGLATDDDIRQSSQNEFSLKTCTTVIRNGDEVSVSSLHVKELQVMASNSKASNLESKLKENNVKRKVQSDLTISKKRSSTVARAFLEFSVQSTVKESLIKRPLLPCLSQRPLLDRQHSGLVECDNLMKTRSNERILDTDSLVIPPLKIGERFSDIYDVILLLDDREHFTKANKGLNYKPNFANRLRSQYQVEVEIRHLPIGDATWIARDKFHETEYVLDFIVERKAVDDLWTSIKDTRYKQQKLRLMRCGLKRLIYLVEGDPNLCEAAESIKTATLTTEILEGFDVQRTRDVYETISRYGDLTNAISKRYGIEIGTMGNKDQRLCKTYDQFREHCNDLEKETISDVFGVMLMQVKLVTEDIALAILERYPTLISLAQSYSQLEGDITAQEQLLGRIRFRNKNKEVGSVVSKNIYKFIWAP
ncbi:hypothetical protein O6H91_13G036900 [Diphasiastrum complanatum]|uniref:Uncharacterized protein n=1 Tax=Diphasiastrum complanatum TaxID=34168 RepID=A0ACC2BTW6_DIPCM|nr:hypothetical protein O6H91_13G036900 [Diphasiastrum complanatum]